MDVQKSEAVVQPTLVQSTRDDSTVASSSNSSFDLPMKHLRRRFWLDQVDPKHGDLALLSCCFVQGLLDCTVFHNYVTFVGMQTGNTVILCLSTAGYPSNQPWAFATTLLSIIAFFIGAFTTTRICTFVGPKRRLVLSINFGCQGLLIALAAGLTTGHIFPTDADDNPEAVLQSLLILGAIVPLAFQSGATIATSRLIGYGNEIPVTVFTSTYAALAGDMKLFKLKGNAPRNRRIAAVCCILGGALCATWIEKKSIGMIGVLWMAAGIKLVMTALVALFLPQKVELPKADKTTAV